ncbi:MAG: type-F conjugative transfer system protein TraW [Rhodocyclaceae bacterium]|nr:type-F conjugative transfer system protein TraW [Rhodocyclaceae bacterium]
MLCAIGACAAAADGAPPVIGPVYPVIEPDFLQQIMAALRAKEASGELAKLQREGARRAQQTALHPAALALPATSSPRTFYFDPTVVAPQNISDQTGRILVAAGTRVNPLERVTLSANWLFFDAREPAQVACARSIAERHEWRVKPILTGGDYAEVARSWGHRVYFDQRGLITQTLGIGQVPALVTQDGARLRIDEMLPEPSCAG